MNTLEEVKEFLNKLSIEFTSEGDEIIITDFSPLPQNAEAWNLFVLDNAQEFIFFGSINAEPSAKAKLHIKLKNKT